MRLRDFRSALAVAVLGMTGILMTTPIPLKAYVFVREFERSGRAETRVSVWERVVYSLIEANDQTAGCRAPGRI
jgi:hypothetical protein